MVRIHRGSHLKGFRGLGMGNDTEKKSPKLNSFGDEEGYSLSTHCFWCGKRVGDGTVDEIVGGKQYRYHPRCFEKRRQDKRIGGVGLTEDDKKKSATESEPCCGRHLSIAARVVYTALRSCDPCYPSYKAIQCWTGLGSEAVSNAINELVVKKIIRRKSGRVARHSVGQPQDHRPLQRHGRRRRRQQVAARYEAELGKLPHRDDRRCFRDSTRRRRLRGRDD